MTGHAPVMVAEALRWLEPARGGVFVDCTLGLGGHTQALLEAGRARDRHRSRHGGHCHGA